MSEAGAEEPIDRVRHLMDKGIDPFSSIPLEHEIDVQGELDDIPPSPRIVPGDHMPESRRHSIA
jgi:hypothetical protein